MTLTLIGLSHHVAPVELRERVTLDVEDAAALARSLGDAVCLSTCNRTELYLAGDDEERASAALERLAGESLAGVLYRLHDEAAALHLFRVAAGLDSLVPGEGEILGQVRTAYEAVPTGPLLDRVFRQALGVGKRVRTETAIGESPASVSSAAAALAAQVFGDLRGRRVLLVGAGRIGELAASNLASRGATIAFVANRTVETARGLAQRFGGSAIGLDEVAAQLGDVDVVVSSTSSPETVLYARDVPSRRRSPLFFIDIATSTAASCTTSTISRRSSPRRLPVVVRRPSAESSSCWRRRSASGRGAPRSTSSLRSRRCGLARRRSAPPSSRRSTAASATMSGARSSP
jgi:glutamyl-tRNA reductase